MKRSAIERLSRPKDQFSDTGSVRSRSRMMASFSPDTRDRKDVGPGWDDTTSIVKEQSTSAKRPVPLHEKSEHRQLRSRRGSRCSRMSRSSSQMGNPLGGTMKPATGKGLGAYFPNQQALLNQTQRSRVLSPSLADLKTSSSVHERQHLMSPKLNKVMSSTDINNGGSKSKKNSLMANLVAQSKLKTVLTKKNRKLKSSRLSSSIRLNSKRKSCGTFDEQKFQTHRERDGYNFRDEELDEDQEEGQDRNQFQETFKKTMIARDVESNEGINNVTIKKEEFETHRVPEAVNAALETSPFNKTEVKHNEQPSAEQRLQKETSTIDQQKNIHMSSSLKYSSQSPFQAHELGLNSEAQKSSNRKKNVSSEVIQFDVDRSTQGGLNATVNTDDNQQLRIQQKPLDNLTNKSCLRSKSKSALHKMLNPDKQTLNQDNNTIVAANALYMQQPGISVNQQQTENFKLTDDAAKMEVKYETGKHNQDNNVVQAQKIPTYRESDLGDTFFKDSPVGIQDQGQNQTLDEKRLARQHYRKQVANSVNQSVEGLPAIGAQKPTISSSAKRRSLSKSGHDQEEVAAQLTKRKKKRISMAIPDENASLQDRISQVTDSVGPSFKQKNSQRNGIWGDNTISSYREGVDLTEQEKFNLESDRNNFITSLQKKEHRSTHSLSQIGSGGKVQPFSMQSNTQKFQQGSLLGFAKDADSSKNNDLQLLVTENLETENSNIESERYQVNSLNINHQTRLSMSNRGSIILSPKKENAPSSRLSNILNKSGSTTDRQTASGGMVSAFQSSKPKHTGAALQSPPAKSYRKCMSPGAAAPGVEIISFREQNQMSDKRGDDGNLEMMEDDDESDDDIGNVDDDMAEKTQQLVAGVDLPRRTTQTKSKF